MTSSVRVLIPSYLLIESGGANSANNSSVESDGQGQNGPSSSSGGSSRPYYAYRVEASVDGGRKFTRVNRRYSQFLQLHNELRKTLRHIPVDFPPKRLRNTSHKLLEERRLGLEAYLQYIVRNVVPTPSAVLEFLELSLEDLNPPTGSLSSVPPSGAGLVSTSNHQPVCGFIKEDPFLHPDTDNRLPDIVIQATLDFFYKKRPNDGL